MKKRVIIFATIVALVLTSCETLIRTLPAPSATPSGPRTIVLDGEAVTEEDVGGFTSWYCKDFVNGGRILVEVGFFGDPGFEGFSFKGMGFILYDGGYSGTSAYYYRDGLDHRWDWGPPGVSYDYSFIIDPDGTGHYVDFSGAEPGETKKTTELFKCYRR